MNECFFRRGERIVRNVQENFQTNEVLLDIFSGFLLCVISHALFEQFDDVAGSFAA